MYIEHLDWTGDELVVRRYATEANCKIKLAPTSMGYDRKLCGYLNIHTALVLPKLRRRCELGQAFLRRLIWEVL